MSLKILEKNLCKKYDQEAILYGDGKEVYVVELDSEFSIGSRVQVSTNDLEEMYSKIKGKKFLFSCVYAPKNFQHDFCFEFPAKRL